MPRLSVRKDASAGLFVVSGPNLLQDAASLNLFAGLQRPGKADKSDPAARPLAQMAPAQVLDLIDRRYKWSRQTKEPYLRTWATCLAFYLGDHYRQWDRRARRLVEPSRIPSWRVQLTDNQIPGVVETAAAKLARSREMPQAQPNTTDPEDINAAEAGTKALLHWWKTAGMEQKELEADLQRLIFGAVFFHDFWDPSAMAQVAVPDLGRMAPNPETGALEPAVQARRVPVGDAAVEILSVFDVFPEPNERWEDVRWVIIARRKPLSWFVEMFGERGKKVSADKGDIESVFETLLPSTGASGFGFGGGSDNTPSTEAMATLKVYYERPSRTFPKGRHAMIGGGQVLYVADALPLPHLELPVTMMGFRLVPKRLWPGGAVEQLLGQQRELNRAQSYTLENLRLHGRPQKLLPREANVDHDSLTNSPDEIVEYSGRAGLKPEYLNPPSLPAWIEVLPEKIRTAIQQIAGQHEVSNARVPSGVTAASAIRLLQEQDDTRLAVAATLKKAALETTCRHVLCTIVERWREPRLVATLGRGQVENVQALLGADIGERDVLVAITEGVANSDAVRSQNFQDWMGTGFFDKVFAGQYPPSFALGVLDRLGESWISETLQQGLEEQAQMQAQQQAMLAQQQQAALLQQGQAQAEAQALQQGQADDERAAQAEEAEAQRAHELQLAQLQQAGQAQQQEAQAGAQMDQAQLQGLFRLLQASQQAQSRAAAPLASASRPKAKR